MTGIKNYRTTPSLNGTVLATGSAVEGMPPSAVNDALRQMMSDTKNWYLNAEWIEYGDGSTAVTPTRVSGTQITINANVSSVYHAGRRIRIVDGTGTTIFGTIVLSAYGSPNTTVTIAWDSGSIGSGTITSLMIGATSALNTSAPTNIPVGGVIIWTQSTLPNGFLLADGSLVNKVDYPVLFSALGNTYGTATSTQFYLPNLADKFVVGKGSTYSTLGATGGASTVTPTGSIASTFTGTEITPAGSIALSGSVADHTLTASQIPNHTHTGSAYYKLAGGNDTDPTGLTERTGFHENGGHTFTSGSDNSYHIANVLIDTAGGSTPTGGQAHNHSFSGTAGFTGTAVTPAGSIASTLTGTSASIINPYIALSYIIKT